MAALVACASLRSYTTDVCVAPSTTRCMLLAEKVARSSCSLSQPGVCVPALTTVSGLSPRLLRPRVWVVVWGVARSSSEGGTNLSRRGAERGDLRALPVRQFGGRGTELVQQADYPDPCQQGSGREYLLLSFVAVACCRPVAELFGVGGIDQGHARHLVGIPGGVRLRVQAAERVAYQHVRALDAGFGEQGVQFARDPPGVPGFRARLAPAHPRAVVGAHARGIGDLPLHPDPIGRRIPQSRVQDHGRGALAHTVDV